MEVLKFNEFINEGFLSKTLDRSKSGKERLEYKLTDEDIDIFYDADIIRNFNKYLSKYDLTEFAKEFKPTLYEHFEPMLVNYVSKHGFTGFGTLSHFNEVETVLEDVKFKMDSNINGKPITFIFTIDGDSKEMIVTCGNENPEEFDITETDFISMLYNKFVESIVVDILQERVDLIEKNLKIYWGDFSETLSEFIHDSVLDVCEAEGEELSLSGFTWDPWDDSFSETIMEVFLINYIDYNNETVKCGYDDNTFKKLSPQTTKKVLDIVKKSYDDAIKEFNSYEDD